MSDIITLVTAAGEMVGRISGEDETSITLENPRAFVRGNPNRLLAGSTIESLEPDDLLNLIFNNYGRDVSNFDTATAGWVRYSR